MKVGSLVLICLLLAIPCLARVITVDDDGIADFNNIQAGINDANDGDEVVVADGLYTGPGNRDIDFGGKAITVRSENGPTNCIIDCNGNSNDPHRAFFFHSWEGVHSVVQGFTVTGGFAKGGFSRESSGGGILCANWARPKVTNCIFRDNYADYGGGGVAGWSEGGGGEITNCTFRNNTATFAGGAAYSNHDETLSLRNCIVWGNKPTDDPGVYGSYEGKAGWQDIRVDYTILQSDWKDKPYVKGANNIVADPCFADANDLHLKSQAGRWDPNSESWVQDAVTSPAIDAGDPANPVGYEPFPNGGIINMGAYGGTAEASKSYFGTTPCETIVAGDINGDCKVNFLDFRLMALHWLEDNNP